MTKIDLEELETENETWEKGICIGITRICKHCGEPTESDEKIGRYCPNGCFKEDIKIGDDQ